MRDYPVDLDPEQVARWLLDETHLQAFDLAMSARRAFVAEPMRGGRSTRLDESEREDIGEAAAVGLLEVTPRRRPGLWTLRLRVEDDIGPRVPEDESVAADEEEIDPWSFFDAFIRPGGPCEITAEVANAAAAEHLDSVLRAIGAPAATKGEGTHRRRPAG